MENSGNRYESKMWGGNRVVTKGCISFTRSKEIYKYKFDYCADKIIHIQKEIRRQKTPNE